MVDERDAQQYAAVTGATAFLVPSRAWAVVAQRIDRGGVARSGVWTLAWREARVLIARNGAVSQLGSSHAKELWIWLHDAVLQPCLLVLEQQPTDAAVSRPEQPVLGVAIPTPGPAVVPAALLQGLADMGWHCSRGNCTSTSTSNSPLQLQATAAALLQAGPVQPPARHLYPSAAPAQ